MVAVKICVAVVANAGLTDDGWKMVPVIHPIR